MFQFGVEFTPTIRIVTESQVQTRRPISVPSVP
jgi:hypothetical protein